MTDSIAIAGVEGQRSQPDAFYYTAWRWHFYSALYVIPFLLMLAVTGLIILWVTAISPEYGDRMDIAVGPKAMSITAQSDAVLKAWPDGKIGRYVAPLGPSNPALFQVNRDAGNRMVALDPYTGTIVHDRPQDGTWNDFATAIHGELLIGDNGGFGDKLVEIAASLGILMLVSGLYLWWPRGEGLKAFVPQVSAKGRALWKSLHSSIGIWMSVVILFFLISGLAWAGMWGGKMVQAWNTFPAEKWDNVPLSDKTHASMNHTAVKEVPWALEQTLMPKSGSPEGVTGLPEGTPVVLESVVLLGRALGFDGRFQVAVPDGEEGVWTLSRDSMSYDSPDPTSDKTVHVDQYTGKVIATVDFEDYSLPGKAMAVGIALHEGQMGWWNIALNIAFCLAIIFLCISGVVMWWRRRPANAGRLMAPPRPDSRGFWVAGGPVVLAIALAFPLGGLALLAVIVLDLLILKRIPALKKAFS